MSRLTKCFLIISFIQYCGSVAIAQMPTPIPEKNLTPAQIAKQRRVFATLDPSLLPKSVNDDKYQARFANLESKVNEALTRGSLSQVEANSYKYKLDRLKDWEFKARKNGFDAKRVARLNKGITQFQDQLLKDGNKPSVAKTDAVIPNVEAGSPQSR